VEDVGHGGHHAGPFGNPRGVVGRPSELAAWTIFTTIRHPGDALVTWYFKSGPPNGYGEFAVRWCEEWLPKIGYVKAEGTNWRLWDWHAKRADTLLRFEDLEAELNGLLEPYGFEPVVLKPENVTQQKVLKRWWDFYDPATRAWVERYFGREIEDYGYTWPEED
jgi:hypothetical protein